MKGDPALPLVLASGSPRRRELLERAGVSFEVLPPGIEELARAGEAPEAMVLRLAREKATAVARRVGGNPRRVVLGADTLVVLGEEVLGKPRDAADAEGILGRLVGRTHRVLTGVAVVSSDGLRVWDHLAASRVRMRQAGADEIRRYVATGEPLDKAGAYAAQGRGRDFIEEIVGSESNVIGLPIDETLGLLGEAASSWR
jgi:septum formation protein